MKNYWLIYNKEYPLGYRRFYLYFPLISKRKVKSDYIEEFDIVELDFPTRFCFSREKGIYLEWQIKFLGFGFGYVSQKDY